MNYEKFENSILKIVKSINLAIVIPALIIHEGLHYYSAKLLGMKDVKIYIFTENPHVFIDDYVVRWKALIINLMPTYYGIACLLFFGIPKEPLTWLDCYMIYIWFATTLPSGSDLRCFWMNIDKMNSYDDIHQS